MYVDLKCFAKVNLSLDIKGLLDNGYHNLDMIMTNIDLYDRVKVVSREDKVVNVICNADIAKEKNSAYKIAMQFINTFNTNGVDIHIKKNIPLSGGLGGSSADAAGVIFALCLMYSIDIDKTFEIVNSIGSDIWYLLKGGMMRAKGQGNILIPIEYRQYYFILSKPKEGVNTSLCFKKYDVMNNNKNILVKGDIDSVIVSLRKKEGLKDKLFNVLTEPSCEINPEISIILDRLKEDKNSLGNVMSGSGSSVIALYNNIKEAKKGLKNCKDFYYKTVVKSVEKSIEIVKFKKS